MRLLKKYFNRENKFSLKERFNMVMTVVTCFLDGGAGNKGSDWWNRRTGCKDEWMAECGDWLGAGRA